MRPDALLETVLRHLGPGTPLHDSLRNSGWRAGSDIAPKKREGARAGYAPYDEAAETPVLLYDGTIFGSARRGLLLTTGALYWSLTSAEDGFSEVRGRLPLGAVKRLAIEGDRVCVNAEAIGTIVKPEPKEVRVLEALFEELEGLERVGDAGLAPALGRASRVAPKSAPDEVFALIRGLKALHEEGALTAAEYAAKKQELLQRL